MRTEARLRRPDGTDIHSSALGIFSRDGTSAEANCGGNRSLLFQNEPQSARTTGLGSDCSVTQN